MSPDLVMESVYLNLTGHKSLIVVLSIDLFVDFILRNHDTFKLIAQIVNLA